MTFQYIPCAYSENEGEHITRNYLMSFLAHTEGVLLGNYHLPVDNSTRECDFVLFNQYGVWVIEVKNWRGCIKIDQINWERDDGFIQHSPLKSIEYKAKMFSSLLENADFRNISVVGFVVLAQSSTELKNTDDGKQREPNGDKIFHLDARLIRALSGRQYLHKADNRGLKEKQIEQIVDMLLPLSVDPEKERIGSSYRIVYDLGPGPDSIFHAYQAVHEKMPGWYARAKKYYAPDAFSTEDLKSAIYRFQRDMQALVQMRNHPNIVQVYDYQTDRDSGDIYWLLVEWLKGDTLQDQLDQGLEFSFQDQLRILYPILDALAFCHSKGILHRNLTPSCVYLANDDAIKLGDFDFARVPDLFGTISITGQPLFMKASRYMAPELQTDARTADVRSDFYAVGAIWYDMIVRPQPYENIDLSRLEETEIPFDARDLLVRLLSPFPDERPRSAKAVKRWLEQV